MSEPTEDRWADARRVLARRTPDSVLVVNRYGAAIVGPGGRTACGLLLTGLATSDDHADNLDALSLAWNVLPDLLAERDRYRAALPPPCPTHGDGFMARGGEWVDGHPVATWYCTWEDDAGGCGFWAPITPESLAVLRGGPASEGGDADAR